jgi:DNA-binding winged helix-turn-helix (wHTH) protein
MDQRELYEFGAFQLDVRNARLLKGRETFALPPKTFDVLVVLARHAGELVDKDALMREVWPDTFVEEANISRHIWTLRKALGDDSLIETVPKRGYRLNAPARVPAGPDTHPRIATSVPSSRWWLWAAATAAAAGLVWMAWSAAATSRPASVRWFALAETSRIEGRFRDAVPLYQRAIELDPEFALAESRLADTYGALREPSARHAHALRAYALRDRATERERLFIDATYYAVLGDRPRQADALQLLIGAYPGEAAAHAALAVVYRETGRFEPALDRAREAARLDPGSADARALLARALVDLNRLDEARSSVEADRDSPSEAMHALGFELAFMRGDREGMRRELAWAARSVNEDAAAQWQAQMHDFLGQRAKARALFARSRVLLQTLGGDQRIAEVEALHASRDAIVGVCPGIESKPGPATASLTFNTLTLASLARALCGDIAGARALADKLTLSSSLDWLNRTVSVPIIRAFIDASAGVRQGEEDPNELARTIEPYELGQTLWPIYLRGLVHMKTGRFEEAAAAFRRILAQRGPAGLSIRYPLANLQLARALARTGDRAGSRKAYEDFLEVWKDADPDLPILIDARKEYALSTKH